MRIAGIVLLVLGLIGIIAFGIQAIQESESVSFLGIDIVASSANWTPVIISGVVLIIGLVMMSFANKQTA